MFHRITLTAAALLAVGGSALAQGRTVNVLATDYKFEAPDSIAAGLTTFRLVARGAEIHHLQVVRFEQGKTFADFQAAMRSEGPPPAWVVYVGGPNAGIPDGQHATTVTTTLAPGNYALLCFIPSPDGKLHVMKGMIRPLTVTGDASAARATQAGAPKADAVMTLYDYNFDIDKPLTAGRRSILVKNTAEQFHEAFLAKLPPGVGAMALLEWLSGGMKGQAPVVPMGGVVALTPGQENVITVDLEPGEYALYCFLPDAKDGKEHAQHGMFKQITVK